MPTFAHVSRQFNVTMIIGVAELVPLQALEGLLKESDEALYAALRTGRNRVVLATDPSSLPALAQAGHAA